MSNQIKDLIISHNEEKGFYCDGFNHELFFVILAKLIEKYDLKTSITTYSEIEMYFNVRQQNKNQFNIELREEDGSEWIFG